MNIAERLLAEAVKHKTRAGHLLSKRLHKLQKKPVTKYKVRKPNKKELEQLRQLLEQQTDREGADDLVKNYHFVVLEGYISDCPGYCGKLLLGVYGCPEFYQLYGWIDGKLVKIEQDEQLR